MTSASPSGSAATSFAAKRSELLLVVGIGRSGTSLLTGILGRLGFYIPQPEVEPDETNPRGFSEPRWVVDFQHSMLTRSRVTVFDSRPSAWERTLRVSEAEEVHERLRGWLTQQFETSPAIAVKDPRTGWFLPLWESCAGDLGVRTSFVTMLRHPVAVAVSARRSYGEWQTDASRIAAWINEALGTERATRGRPRAFVRYDDLLEDWGSEMTRIAASLDMPLLDGFSPERAPDAAELVDPGLRRSPTDWDAVGAPPYLRDLAERVWSATGELRTDSGSPPSALAELRAEYDALHQELEAVVQSSIVAVDPRYHRRPREPLNFKGRMAQLLPPATRRRVVGGLRSLRESPRPRE